MFALGVFFWLLYGLYTGSMPIIVCNAANLFLSMSIVLLKLRFDRHPTGELHP
jgi:MtN3 and saliva related transmembrane protein